MSLDLVQGARHFGKTITWTREDGSAVDLTDAAITGRMEQIGVASSARDIDGTLTGVSPYTTGIFTWAPGTTDVKDAGNFKVQFIATYPDSKVEKSIPQTMRVFEAI